MEPHPHERLELLENKQMKTCKNDLCGALMGDSPEVYCKCCKAMVNKGYNFGFVLGTICGLIGGLIAAIREVL